MARILTTIPAEQEEQLDRLARKSKFKKTRKPRSSKGGGGSWGTATTKTGSLPRSGGKPQSLPEWMYLFSQDEWNSLHPIDREEIKKTIVQLSKWYDAYDLSKVFPGYDWRRINAVTKAKLLLYSFDREQLPKVHFLTLDGTQEVYALVENQGHNQQVFTKDLVPVFAIADRLSVNF